MSDNSSGVLALAKQGSITLIGNILGRGLGFVFVIVVTRFLSPSDYGVLTLSISILMFCQGVASLNLYSGISYFIPQFIQNRNFDKARAVIWNIFIISGVTTIMGGIFVFIFADIFIDLFNESKLSLILPFFWLLIPITNIKQILTGLFESVKKLKYRVYMQSILDPGGRIIIVFILLSFGGGLVELAKGYLLGIAIAVMIGLVFAMLNIEWLIGGTIGRVSQKNIFSYSLPLLFAGVIYAITGRIDYFMIGYFMNSSDVGVYRVAFLLASNLLVVLKAITPVFKPMIAENNNCNSILQDRYQLATRWVSVLTVPVAITFFVGSEIYLSLFFTPEYAVGSTTMIALTGGYVLNASFGPEGMMLEGLGYTRFTLVNTVLLLITNATLNFLLIPMFGIVGAGLATACAVTVAGAAGVVELFYLRGLHPYTQSLLISWVAAILPATLGGAIIFFGLHTIFQAFFLPVIVLVSYTVALRELGGFTEDDAAVMRNIDSKVGYPVMSKITGL